MHRWPSPLPQMTLSPSRNSTTFSNAVPSSWIFSPAARAGVAVTDVIVWFGAMSVHVLTAA